MRALVHLNVSELTEAVLEYLDNNSENIKIPEYAGVSVEFVHEAGGVDKVIGARVVVEEKLVKDNS